MDMGTLRQLAPRASRFILEGLIEHADLLDDADITPGLRRQHFLAQIAHESDGFRVTREYASGRAYEGRLDLGNTEVGDGMRYRGRGLIQLTGRANYQAFDDAYGAISVEQPEILEEFPFALETAVWFWTRRGLNAYADADDLIRITRRINGGQNGIESRRVYLNKAKELNL